MVVLFVLFWLIKVLLICDKKFEVVELERNFVEFVEFVEFEMFLTTVFKLSIELELSGKSRTMPSGVSTHIYNPVEYIGILLIVLLIPQTRLQLRKLESPGIIKPLNIKNSHQIINFEYVILLFM